MFEPKLQLRKSMKETYLIQRLRKPAQWVIGDKQIDDPFSFGGGLKNGGINKNAMDLLRPIFSFDYMGSAEFEWGAVPNALSFLAEQASAHNIISGTIAPNAGETIYFICPKNYKDEVINRLNLLRKNAIGLKEWCGLDLFFDSKREYYKQNVGWIELDNGFMFFVDKDMFDKTCKLFEM